MISNVLGNEGTLPGMDRLKSAPSGRSSRSLFVHGEVKGSQSLTYFVTVTRAGTFAVPAFRIGSGHDAAASHPIALRITGSGSTPVPHNERTA